MKTIFNIMAILLLAGRVPTEAAESTTFNILDYSAVANWETKSTEAIRKTIDAAAKAGGGTVTIPAGHFLTGPIHLKSNITLFLNGGAHVKFSTDFDDYLPMVPSRFEGVEVMNFSPLIYANDATNIAIRGRGILDGQGQTWWAYLDEVKRQKTGDEKSRWQKEFLRMNPDKVISTTVSGGVPLDFLCPPMIQPYNCIFDGTDRGIRLKSTRGRGGVVEDIRVSNYASISNPTY